MKDSNLSNESGQAADVILDVKFQNGLLFLGVKNIGHRPALNVSVAFKQRLVGINGTKIVSSLPLFRKITFLAPQKEIQTLLDTSASYFKRRQPKSIRAVVSFEDEAGAKFIRPVCHD